MGAKFKRSERMKRCFSRVDSLMPLTWERKGGGGKKKDGIRMKQTVEIKERKRKGEIEKERESG